MRLVIAFDLDDTLFNFDATEKDGTIEWNGSKELWIALCWQLINWKMECEVKIYFSIVTAKSRIDVLVHEAVDAFKDFLCSVVHNPSLDQTYCQSVMQLDGWDVCFDGENLVYTGDDFMPIERYSPVHITCGKNKSPALKRLKSIFDIEHPEYVILVDDNPNYYQEVAEHGFSYVCAKKINSKGNTSEQRHAETKRVISAILETVKEKIILMKLNHADSLIRAGKLGRLEVFINTKMPDELDFLQILTARKPDSVKFLLDHQIVEPSRVIRVNPKFAFAYYVQALNFIKSGQYEVAIANLRTCIDLEPDNDKFISAYRKCKAQQEEVDKPFLLQEVSFICPFLFFSRSIKDVLGGLSFQSEDDGMAKKSAI